MGDAHKLSRNIWWGRSRPQSRVSYWPLMPHFYDGDQGFHSWEHTHHHQINDVDGKSSRWPGEVGDSSTLASNDDTCLHSYQNAHPHADGAPL